MKRLLYLATLSLVASMVFAPAALAQAGLYNCPDFQYQEDAQQFLLAGDPYILDEDDDGIACETLPSRGTDTGMTQRPTTPTQYVQPMTPTTQYTPTTAAEAVDEETPSTTTTTPLPDTGGVSLLIPASLLLASGLIGLGVMRRK